MQKQGWFSSGTAARGEPSLVILRIRSKEMRAAKPLYFHKECEPDVLLGSRIYVRFPFLKTEYRLLRYLPPSARVLDIGCGEGAFLSRAMALRPDLRLVGLDISDYLEFISEDDIEFVECDLEKDAIPLMAGSIDFIRCTHVIEHLKDPLPVFEQVFSLLNKGGLAYIDGPDVRATFIPHLGGIGITNFYDEPSHVRPFTRECLRRLGAMAGFKRIEAFQARNWAWLVASPGLLLKFISTGHANYLYSALQPVLGLDAGCILYK